MRTTLAVASAVVALVGLTAQAGAASTKTIACGQLKGPHASWMLPAPVASALHIGRTLSGTTWTVFATGAPCAMAMKYGPQLLTYWTAHHKDFKPLDLPGGWVCSADHDLGVSGSGGIGCVGTSANTIQLNMYGDHSLAELSAFVAAHGG
jgi:hypothetical protein